MSNLSTCSDKELVREICKRASEGRISDVEALKGLLDTLRRLGIVNVSNRIN